MRNLDAFADVQTRCHVASDVEQVNQLLEESRVLSLQKLLGIHVGVFGYVNPLVEDSRLFYLTSDDPGDPAETVRKVRWPFLIDSVAGEWTLEDPNCQRVRLDLASRIRREEYSEYSKPVSRTLETLASLSDGSQSNPSDCSPLELDRLLLYAPMGEILTALLGWHFHCFVSPGNNDFDLLANLDLSLGFEDALRSSPAAQILSRLKAESEQDKLPFLPGLALIVSGHQGRRPVTWRTIMHDLGLISDEMNPAAGLNNSRLGALAHWLLGQASGNNMLLRPSLAIDFTREERLRLERYANSRESAATEATEAFSSIVRALLRARSETSLDWERKFHFGFANHLIWMSVGRPSRTRWLSAYDWTCFQVLPGQAVAFGDFNSKTRVLPNGVAFVTFRTTRRNWENLDRLRSRIEWVRAFTLALATAENRFSYYAGISKQRKFLKEAIRFQTAKDFQPVGDTVLED